MNTPNILNTAPGVLNNLPDAMTAPRLSTVHDSGAGVVRKPARGPYTTNLRIKHLLAGALLATVVGCGTTTRDRAVSGAGIGAGAGAILGTVTGMGPGTGAAVGAAAGAAAGGLTKKKQINLGKPIWR